MGFIAWKLHRGNKLTPESLHQFFNFFSAQDLTGLEAMLHREAEFSFPKTEPLIGREQIVRFLKILFQKYPRLTFTIQRIIIQKDTAAVHWTNIGYDRKGNGYSNEGVSVFEGEGHSFTFISDFFKNTEKF